MIKAIETEYNGYRFRSRLEARWAVFFDAANIKYEYEIEGFELDTGERYLPDFYLPEYDWYVEIKPPRDKAANDLMRTVKFIDGVHIKSLLLLGNIPPDIADVQLWHYWILFYNPLFNLVSTQTIICNIAWKDSGDDFEYNGLLFDQFYADIRNYKVFNEYGLVRDYIKYLTPVHDRELESDFAYCDTYDDDDAKYISKIYRKARKSRFEHGEKG